MRDNNMRATNMRGATMRGATMRGGKSILSGSFGCVFRPALRCPDDTTERNEKNISKVFYKPHIFDLELELGTMIKSMDPQGRYHVPIIKSCTTTPTLIDPQIDTTEKCDKPLQLDKESYYQFIQPYAGTDLYHYRAKSSHELNKLLTSMINLFDGLILFKKYGFVHRDIKSENILYDTETGQTRFIDFSLSLYAKDVATNPSKYFNSENRYPLKRIYHPYPPDILLMNYEQERWLYTEKITELEQKIQKTSYNYYELNPNIKGEIAQLYQNANKINIYDCLMSLDTFSLGVVLWEVLQFNKGYVSRRLYNELCGLVAKMTRILYLNRISIEKARSEYKSILSMRSKSIRRNRYTKKSTTKL